MKVVVYINSVFEHQVEWCGAMVEGLKSLGINVKVSHNDIPIACDYAVMWSHGPTWANVIADRRKRKLDYVVLDRGVVGGQMESACIGMNGLRRESIFQPSLMINDRSEQYSSLMKKWKPGKEYVLLMGQLPGDASLSGLDINSWTRARVREIEAAGYKVIYRPHPRAKYTQPYGVPFMTADLDDCFKRALCVYTYSSTSGADALLAGVPVIAESENSPVYDMVGHGVADIKQAKKQPDRQQWLNDIAHIQFSLDEFKNGYAWTHLMEWING